MPNYTHCWPRSNN